LDLRNDRHHRRAFRGSAPNREFLAAFATLVERIEAMTGKSWLEDAYTFVAVQGALERVFWFLKPAGKEVPPEDFQKRAEDEPHLGSAYVFGGLMGMGLGHRSGAAESDSVAELNAAEKVQALQQRLGIVEEDK
jgi:hypothetical protein